MFRGETVNEWMSPRAEQLRAELAGKIAFLMGSVKNRATEIAGLKRHRRPAPTAPCSMTYQASVTVIARGRKRVELGKSVFVYDPSRFLLTSVDLPVVSRIVYASEARPCLAMSLQLSIAMVREVLNRNVIAGGGAPPRSPAMATGETTPEFLHACGRLLDLLQKPENIPHREGDRRAAAELYQADTDRGVTRGRRHGGFDVPSPLPHADGEEPAAVPKTVSVAGGSGAHAVGRSAAFEVGYESASQFNREYSRYFDSPLFVIFELGGRAAA